MPAINDWNEATEDDDRMIYFNEYEVVTDGTYEFKILVGGSWITTSHSRTIRAMPTRKPDDYIRRQKKSSL